MSLRFTLFWVFGVGGALAGQCVAAPSAALPETIDFNRDIRPILSENCFFCHGPDKAHRKADLRLDTQAGLVTAIEGKRFPVVAGKVGESEIYKRLITADDADRMPDPKSGKHLSERDIALVKKWIEQGAPWKGHWAYEKPIKSAAPAIADQGKLSAIDAFVLQKLSARGLSFSKEADKGTLIRRLYFDLVGLPPSTVEVDAFVADSSPRAFETVVDRLLASPHFGERMAVHWLDLVRFADTIGYHSDTPRDITPYRDWVINAYNANMPFDQFTREQLAGDLLANPTVQQKVASGYNRLLQTTEEGGAQPEEYAAKYLADRVRNVSAVWLAGTMGCCECHDHKFDPFTQKDFYSLAAFFADVKEAPVGKREAGMPVATAAQTEEMTRLEGVITQVQKELEKENTAVSTAQREWETSQAGRKALEWTLLTPATYKSSGGATLKLEKDNSILASGKSPDTDTYTITLKTKLKNVTAIKLEVMPDKSLPLKGPGRGGNGNFVLTEIELAASLPGDAKGSVPLPINFAAASASYEQIDGGPSNPYKKFSAAAAIDQDAKGPTWGWAIMEQVGKENFAIFETATDLPARNADEEMTLTITLKHNWGQKHAIGKFRIWGTNSDRPVRADSDLPKEVVTALNAATAKRTPAQRDLIAKYFRSITTLLAKERAAVAALEKKKTDLAGSFRKSLVTIAQEPKPVKILKRGNWQDDSGEVVPPAVPHFLPAIAMPASVGAAPARPTRLDLANWLTSGNNPLTARVVVNRLWKLYFGMGLSKSLEDFGSQGEWPTHPELLDHLACEFVDSKWDVKHMIRLMVTSKAYRQSSFASKELKELDPFNRLLARQSRWRLDAEFVRDNALAAAGLLNKSIGGESVRPYQPDGYWDFLNFPKRTYMPDHNASQYRRGLYVWVQRAFPHTSLTNFDAPSREECTCERTRSNTPQQALTLLNDPTYVEAARVFAQRILTEPPAGASSAERLTWAYRTALQRSPKPAELQTLETLLAQHRDQYAKDAKAAEALVSIGDAPRAKEIAVADLAAMTNVARAILNLHEMITRN